MRTCKTYSELLQFKTFQERLLYLELKGSVGIETFGFDRYLNQTFYKSVEWKRFRDQIIIRDNGCDLGVPGCEIFGKIYIHHINPILQDDILNRNLDTLMNPENVICTSFETHNAIHYGIDNNISSREPIVRTRNDTCPWKH